MTNYRMTNDEGHHVTARRASAVRFRRTGGMLPLIAICLPLFIIAAAFAVDVAYMQLARTELRTATDAAALFFFFFFFFF